LLKEQAETWYVLEQMMASLRFEWKGDLVYEPPTSARENVVPLSIEHSFRAVLGAREVNSPDRAAPAVSSEHESLEETGPENPMGSGQGDNGTDDMDCDWEMLDVGGGTYSGNPDAME
jgi:hypothetical protein